MLKLKKWTYSIALSAVALLVLLPACLEAQSTNGTLTGTVADASGAVIPGADVVLKNVSSGDERRTVN